MHRVALRLALALALASTSGCGRAARDIVAGALTSPLEKPVLRPASPAQTQAFVDALSAALGAADPKAINALIDWKTLAERACAGMRVVPGLIDGFVTTASATAVERGMPAQLAAASKASAQFTFLGKETRAGEVWQTFRLIHQEGGFDHISFLVALDAQGTARAVDMEMLTAGEAVSSTVRRVILPLVAVDAKSVLERATGRDAVLLENMKSVIEIQKLAAEGKAQQALALYDKLPESLRHEKYLMILRVGIASGLGEPTYLGAIEELARVHPNDPGTAVHMIDGNLLAKRWDASLAAVDTIEKASIADPYFDVVRANVNLTAERLPAARAAAERAIAREPTLPNGYWSLISTTLKQREFAETVRVMLSMRERFGLSFAPEGVADFDEFVKSPEYTKAKTSLTE